MPQPRWVMAVGTCAVSGGVAGGGYACGNGLEGVLPVDLYLPGCPPNPAAMIEALLMFLDRTPAEGQGRPPCRMTSWPSALAAWLVAAILALDRVGQVLARALLALGGVALLVLDRNDVAERTAAHSHGAGDRPRGRRTFCCRRMRSGCWASACVGAVLASWLGTPAPRQRAWIFGAAASLLGALGVFGLQDAASFLVAWEIMSLGGAVMILGEDLASETGRPVLFMLALLEVGAVALMLAFILLAGHADSLSFATLPPPPLAMPRAEQLFVGLLLVIGFGAKLGLLPFYEWFPGAYGAGSGATGALLSGVVLNAAFFALSRGLSSGCRSITRCRSRSPASSSSPLPCSARS